MKNKNPNTIKAIIPSKKPSPLLDASVLGGGLIIVVAIGIHLFSLNYTCLSTFHRKIDAISPTIITSTKILESPAIARIPRTDKIHKRRSIEAIA